jgi:tyrosyl-tRNA synthetase
MRQILTMDTVEQNVVALKRQLGRFIDFDQDRALLMNNADWLTRLEYIPFLRDIGRHFSVNRMLKAESYRMRLDSEEGLNFIEFNYMLLQAYDFLALYDRTGCQLQMGGSDQWGNIVAGIDLVRKMRQKQTFGVTFQLITTASGAKMGKTAAGAVWLDAKRTSPYDYFQYWVNTDDKDTARFLALYTFLPLDEIQAVERMEGADLNAAKAIMAFEATAMVHGRKEALNALRAAASVFGSRHIPQDLLPSSSIPRGVADSGTDEVPHTVIPDKELSEGIPLFKMFHRVGLSDSGGAARRLITQGGAYVNGERVRSLDYMLTESDASDGQILLRSGKKKFHKVIVHSE